MKREEVKNKIPGITDEQLDWLMGENGRDVTAEKTKAASLQGQVDDLTKQLNTAKDGLKAFEGVDVADLKGQITKLQGQLTDQADSFAFDAALDGAIRDARGRDVKAIRGMLDVAALKASKDRTSDIKTALDALVKDKAWAFDAAPGGYPNVKDGGEAAAPRQGRHGGRRGGCFRVDESELESVSFTERSQLWHMQIRNAGASWWTLSCATSL